TGPSLKKPKRDGLVFNIKNKIMGATSITTEDLHGPKLEMGQERTQLLEHHSGARPNKWLKCGEVMELLGISAGTLQDLRLNGTLPYTEVGGILYYDHREIMGVLESNRVDPNF